MSRAHSFITGLGSGGALLAAVGVAFATLAALVTFSGLPWTTADGAGGEALVIGDSNAPEAAAAAASGSGAAPAAEPSPPATPPAAPAVETAFPGPDPAASPRPPGGGGPDGITGVIPPLSGSPAEPSPRGPLGSLVDEVDSVLGVSTGLDTSLGSRTRDLVDALDATIRELVGGSGLLDDPILPDPPQVVDLSALNLLLPPG